MKSALVLGNQPIQTIELPAEVADMLKSEARRSRQSIAEFIMQWLEDQIDGCQAASRMKRVKEGKSKLMPAEEVYAKLGI